VLTGGLLKDPEILIARAAKAIVEVAPSIEALATALDL
jgi:hypothetical protein